MLTFNNVNSVFRGMQQVFPPGHVENAEEIAHAVLFLATDEASHISRRLSSGRQWGHGKITEDKSRHCPSGSVFS
ncbi:hypothetical protein [Exiguobacterium sp. N4-1P]|uniref:hypothetical protein n=1 Tax=Exiguobacterium sp. N4-1P TaxID=2051906 RepID=UPI0012FFAC05|nr:hypothetical protein [Exiguobacterium sp. N4-1P]